MAGRHTEQDKMDAAFRVFEGIFEGETHNDASLFRTVEAICSINVHLARVIMIHIADILDEATDEVNYTSVLSQAFYRAIFDLSLADKYSTAVFGSNAEAAMQWARTCVAMESKGIHALLHGTAAIN